MAGYTTAGMPSNQPVLASQGRGFGFGNRGRIGIGSPGFHRPTKTPQEKALAAEAHKARIQKSLFDNLGKQIMPKSPSLILIDLVGYSVKTDYIESTDDDYEEFYEEKGFYPTYLHKCEVTVSFFCA